MNNLDFKNNFWTDVVNLTKLTWIKISAVYIILTIAFYILILGATLYVFKSIGIEKLFDFQDLSKFEQIGESMQNLLSSDMMKWFFIAYAAIILIMLIPGAWYNNLMFQITNDQVKKENLSFGQLISNSFNKKVLSTVLLIITLYIIMIIGFGLIALCTAFLGGFSFFIFLAAFIFMFKFLLVVPAFVLSDKSITESYEFSFKHMTNKRCLKIFLYIVVIYICLFVVLILISAIGFSMFDYTDLLTQQNNGFGFESIIQLIFQFAIGGIMASFFYSMMSGLYYRYELTNIETTEDSNNADALTK